MSMFEVVIAALVGVAAWDAAGALYARFMPRREYVLARYQKDGCSYYRRTRCYQSADGTWFVSDIGLESRLDDLCAWRPLTPKASAYYQANPPTEEPAD